MTSLASSLLLTQAGALLHAQPSPAAIPAATDEKKDEVVMLDAFRVTSGYASSLAAATEIKEKVAAITEVLAAEDIGKLPDISIADSLARLPGLATQRLNGRSQAISIRGLTGDFSTGLLNGREQVSTNSNRAVEFDQYPAELLSGAVVYKTTDASLIGQGLAGTVDLRTVRPLAHGRQTFAANAFYEWTDFGKLNPDSDRMGVRYTGSYIDQFQKGTLGIAVGFSHSDRPGQGKQWNAWGYPNVDYNSSMPFVLGGAKPFVRSSSLKRDGLVATVEYKPNSWVHSTFDLFRSRFNEKQTLRGIEIPLYWSSAQLQSGYTTQDNLVTKATFKNVYGVVRNDAVRRDDDIWSLGWNLQFGDGSGWTTVADLSFSRVYRKDTVLETYSGAGSTAGFGSADTMTVTMGSGTGAVFGSSLDYTNASLMRLCSPQGWGGDIVTGGQVGYLKNPTAKDQLTQLRLSTKHDLKSWFNNIEFGTTFSRRAKNEVEDGYYIALANAATSAAMPTSIGTADLSFIGIKGMAAYDPLAVLASNTYVLMRNPNADVVSSDWRVEEKVTTGYVMMGIDGKLGTRPLTGNMGFQLINTDQSSTGLAATGTGNYAKYVPVKGGKTYYDVVPSLNLVYKLSDAQYLRFSVARQVARQRMANMRAGTNFSYNPNLANSTDPYNSPWTGSGGNPDLKPWRSNSIDMSWEHYFANRQGYVSLAGFYKDLRNYTYDQTVLADFTGFPTDGTTPKIYQGTVTRPVNGSGGKIKGLEATLSLPSELITKQVPGFGIVLSGAYTKSSIKPYGPSSGDTPIPGLSERVWNMTFYYERHGFAARISERYRSTYRANVYTFGPRGETYRNVAPERVLDAQVSYEFRKGALKGLTLIAQGNNLTNEPLKTYENDPRFVIDYQEYGASFSIGASYKY